MPRAILFFIFIFTSIFATSQTRDELLGKSSVTDSVKWTRKNGYILLKETYRAFDRMAAAAKEDGINLRIISAYRSFEHQKGIWEKKWNARKSLGKKERALNILKWSSMPSTSRHHWGTEVDLNSLSPAFFRSGKGKQMHEWMEINASRFGFYQPYTEGRTTGYSAEQWHWSYKPIADRYEIEYLNSITNEDITGFSGSDIATEIDMIEGWVRIGY